MPIELHEHQKLAISQLRTGSILQGGVGSGKSLAALGYYLEKEHPKPLYIITTAAKRNSGEWAEEADKLKVTTSIVVDSWNNIRKYSKIRDSFFIFDEQRVVGSGSWVRSFLKIAKANNWILLSATPGDTWLDYIPVFIANGFYKNRTEFIFEHVVWNNFTKYPTVRRYIETGKLIRLRNQITVPMSYEKKTISIVEDVMMPYDKKKYDLVQKDRWNPFTNLPIRDVAEYCLTRRRVVNSDPSRLARVTTLIEKHQRVIVFYNFNYELDILRNLSMYPKITIAEYNGQKHDKIPDTFMWAYLVQYNAGAEGWNCIETNAVVFYSLNYSYRTMLQAGGRIDRMNTPFAKLFYYRLVSQSSIDQAILESLKNKKDFNERRYAKKELDE